MVLLEKTTGVFDGVIHQLKVRRATPHLRVQIVDRYERDLA